MKKEYAAGARVMGSWAIRQLIGEGSYGRVYEIERENFGIYHAALKVITVPQSVAELKNALEEGMDEASVHSYFYSVVEDIVREFSLMSKLKGHTNIVSYEDHEVIPHQDALGWDILIRMELLTPLLTYAYAHPFSRRDIIRLGIGMCQALELCQKYNIIHRDIKPENIFVSENGDFKLGDFGIARTVEKTMSGLSKKGTYSYMAPEVYRGAAYGFGVDIYSLGIVLYRLLNNNRIPFLPPAPAAITYGERERALARRMGGEAIPPPVNSEGRLAEIVQKACAFDSRERYSSPMQMKQELEAIQYDAADAAVIYPSGDELALRENQYVSRKPAAPKESSVQDSKTEGGTQSIFGADQAPGAESPQTDGTSRTESIFGGNAPVSEKTDATESVFSPPGTQSESKPPQAVKKQKKALWISAAALTLACVILGGFFAIRGLIPKEPKEPSPPDIAGPSLETQIPSPSPDETKIPGVEDGQLVLTQQIKAENRAPLETVRVALVQASEWPVALALDDKNVILNEYFIDEWLIEAKVIKGSFNEEIYYVGNPTKSETGFKVVCDKLDTILSENDLIILAEPWLDALVFGASHGGDFPATLSKHPDKEVIISDGGNATYLVFDEGEPMPDNLTILYNSSMDYNMMKDMLPSYLLGAAAAASSDAGILGITVTKSWDIYDVQFFAQGAASVNPDVNILLYGDKLTDDDELTAVQALEKAGCDAVWCSASNKGARSIARELGIRVFCLGAKGSKEDADAVMSPVKGYFNDVNTAIQCMKEGWQIAPCVNAPAYAYLDQAVEERATETVVAAREGFGAAYAHWQRSDMQSFDCADMGVLRLPPLNERLSFLPQPLNGKWLISSSYDERFVQLDGAYYNVTQTDFWNLVEVAFANMQEVMDQGQEHLLGIIVSEGIRYRLGIFYNETEEGAYIYVAMDPMDE